MATFTLLIEQLSTFTVCPNLHITQLKWLQVPFQLLPLSSCVFAILNSYNCYQSYLMMAILTALTDVLPVGHGPIGVCVTTVNIYITQWTTVNIYNTQWQLSTFTILSDNCQHWHYSVTTFNFYINQWTTVNIYTTQWQMSTFTLLSDNCQR